MNFLNRIAPHVHWCLRIALASVFLYHGLPKLTNLTQVAQMMQMSAVMVLLVGLAEVVGSVLVLLGGFLADWMTRIGALLLMPVMLGAIFMVHWGQWNFIASESHKMGGMEFQVALLLIQIYLVVKGNAVKGEAAASSS